VKKLKIIQINYLCNTNNLKINLMENEIVCMICFDNFTIDNSPCINPIDCDCKFEIHEECWLKWGCINKVVLECPLCHKHIEELDEETEEETEEEIQNHQNQEIQPNNPILSCYYIIRLIITIKIIYMSVKILFILIGYILLFFF